MNVSFRSMLIRVTRPREGEVDGFDLADLAVGESYDLPSALAMYVVVTQSAELVPADAQEPNTPPRLSERRGIGGVWPGWEMAADRSRRTP
jgi:hypothetical protein